MYLIAFGDLVQKNTEMAKHRRRNAMRFQNSFISPLKVFRFFQKCRSTARRRLGQRFAFCVWVSGQNSAIARAKILVCFNTKRRSYNLLMVHYDPSTSRRKFHTSSSSEVETP